MPTLVRNGRVLTLGAALGTARGTALGAAPAAGGAAAPGATGTTATGVDFHTEMTASLNFRRVHTGARLLRLDDRLTAAAQRHADDLAAHGLVQHDGTDGSTPWRRLRAAGFAFRFAAEIVAPADSVPAAVQLWMNSPQHRDTVLDPRFNHLGVGHAPGRFGARGRYVLALAQV
ncbi:CAP domain-containing protein [Kitasatospora sp. NPDC004669]|uniref:CAP domain-containing protein n=1 Tax=Kitasatospora sp. NPDC004669 TaxID=3154555 RepID=UPI0033BB2572